MKTYTNLSILGAILSSLLAPDTLHAHHHAIAMHGQPRYPQNFTHFNYVNPNAPKGGTFRIAQIGSFDSLNPFIPTGIAGFGIREFVYESLLTRSFDEPFSLYGLLAQKITIDKKRRWITFTLHPNAQFSNGSPVRVEDILFSLNTLRDKGQPNHRLYYQQVHSATKTSHNSITFTFTQNNNNVINWEMPLIIGLMPILSKKHFTQYGFEQNRSSPPVGSGPYILEKAKTGQLIYFRRNKNYWGRNLPVNRGRYNFDQIIVEYYRDDNTSFEAFKTSQYDMREETSPKKWALNYDFPAIKRGNIIKHRFPLKIPSGMWAIVLNSRKPLFENPLIRQALWLSLDTDWLNKNLFHNLWQRTHSFWARSELASTDKPPKAVRFSSQNKRKIKSQIFRLFEKAGWVIRHHKMVHQQTNQPFRFEILTQSRQNERIALIWRQQLKALGIDADIRFIDNSQYQRRRQQYDYDAIFARWYLSLSPGNEQQFYWSRQAANTPASRNYPGVQSQKIDHYIQKIAAAKSRSELITQTKQLDQALLEGFYMIPLFHADHQWVAVRKEYRWPKKTSLYGYRIDNWWRE